MAQKSNFGVTPLRHNFWHLGYISEDVGKQKNDTGQLDQIAKLSEVW